MSGLNKLHKAVNLLGLLPSGALNRLVPSRGRSIRLSYMACTISTAVVL